MKNILSLVLAGLATLALSAPGRSDARNLLRRAIGDTCKAPEGSGTCETTSECRGISYPTGLCPNDPTNVQCCVEIICESGKRSGFCRSVENNGCSQGKFISGKCPGPNDIKCCIKNLASGPLSPTAVDAEAEAEAEAKAEAAAAAWPECRETLSCTFTQLEETSMEERLEYVRYMQSQHFGPLNCGDQFRAIEGVIRFFIIKGLGRPGTWVSYVDAGIVEAIQRGGAMALGMSSDTGGNSGSAKWGIFMKEMRDGGYGGRDAHDKAWSESEQAATEYGVDKGYAAGGEITGQTRRWYLFTQLFRYIMRNRSYFKIALPGNLLDWLTDVTNYVPTFCGSLAAWEMSEFDGLALGYDDWLDNAKILAKLNSVVIFCFGRDKVSDIVRLWPS